MADVRNLRTLQNQLDANLIALSTANASNAIAIQENISNLRREIGCLLYIVNFQWDVTAKKNSMPPPPTPKL